MRGYGYFLERDREWFPNSQRLPEQELVDARLVKENTPAKVLSEMAVVFGTSLAVVLLIDVAVLLVSITM
jgi:hypothetical protein